MSELPMADARQNDQIVEQIGLEFEVRADVLRIWGYLPKSYEDFPPA